MIQTLERPAGLTLSVTAYRQEVARRQREAVARDSDAIRERCKTLAGFVREAWPILEPSNPYVHGWHIDAICEHLEAITLGQLIRLLINIPPGTMKSLLVGVFWPAWEWGPKGMAAMRYLGSSYSEDYAKRDNGRMRDLVASDWYQALWPVRLVRTGETLFDNTATGFRKGVPFSRLTGGRGDRVIIDDPHSTEDAESEAERSRALRIFTESVPTRLNNPERSAIIVIMQRLHEDDVSGAILARQLGYEHLMLPMEFEPARRCRTSINWKDPRKREGELLFPARFPRAVVERDKRVMGSYATAGQFQQRPAPREGGLFQRAWFHVKREIPAGYRQRVRAWDLAASKKTASNNPDWTAGLLMSRGAEGDFLIEGVIRMQASAGAVRQTLKSTAAIDGGLVTIRLTQDPGQAGKDQAEQLIKELAGYTIAMKLATGEKTVRANPASIQAEAGNVSILVTGDAVRDAWVEPFLAEVETFPAGSHDDQCLVAGTMVRTRTGDIPIERIAVGDEVLTRNGHRRVTWAGMTNAAASVVTAKFSDGRTLTGTRNHPVWIDGKGFVPLDAIADAGYISSCPSGGKGGNSSIRSARSAGPGSEDQAEGRHARVSARRIIDGQRPAAVYNLTVEGAHEFFANGILVHNCDAFADALNQLALGAGGVAFVSSNTRAPETDMWSTAPAISRPRRRLERMG